MSVSAQMENIRLKNRLATIKERASETGKVVGHLALATGTGVATAFIHGRRGSMPTLFGKDQKDSAGNVIKGADGQPKKEGGVGLDLLIGGLGTAAGVIGVAMGKSWGSWVAAAGSGPLNYNLNFQAAKLGQRLRKEAGEQKNESNERTLPITAGAQRVDMNDMNRQPQFA